MIVTSPTTTEIYKKLFAFRSMIKEPGKNKENTFLRNRYADLGSWVKEIHDTAQSLGILILQPISYDPAGPGPGMSQTPHPIQLDRTEGGKNPLAGKKDIPATDAYTLSIGLVPMYIDTRFIDVDSGEWVNFTGVWWSHIEAGGTLNAAMQQGVTNTYARRYMLKSALFLIDADTDGVGAGRLKAEQKQPWVQKAATNVPVKPSLPAANAQGKPGAPIQK